MDQAAFDRAINFLEDEEVGLAESAQKLFQRASNLGADWNDYSYIVFPMAKAYEGYLKRYFFELGLINRKVYEGKRFRIGRALNPDVKPSHRDEYWLYDDLERRCGPEVARELWEAWLECRNRIFHYFPKHFKSLTLDEAGHCITQLAQTIEAAGVCQRVNSQDIVE